MRLERSKGVSLEDWKVCLEAAGEEQVLMRITGRDRMENWVHTSPVEEVCLAFYGWQVFTENPEETYLLRPDNERLRSERGLWGSLRETWSSLAEKLPEELRLFAYLWEDPPGLCLCDVKEDRERLEEWSRQYRIRKDFQTLYLYVICMDKTRRERGWSHMQQWQLRKWRGKGGFFLCLNEDRSYCLETLLTDDRVVHSEWNYISQEITEGQPPLVHVRASYECRDTPWSLYLVISYRLMGENQIELTEASCCFELLEIVHNYWKPGEQSSPYWFLDRELYVCNAGEEILQISGCAGERALRPGMEMMIPMQEVKITEIFSMTRPMGGQRD